MSLDRTEIPVTDDSTDQAAPAPAAEQPSTDAPAAPAEAPKSTQPTAPSETTKEVDIEGYKLTVDYDLVDDVDNLELINKIEQGGYLYGIIEFLQKIVGQDEYDNLKAYFVKKEGKLSLTKLGEIYQKIFEQFSPKG